MYTCNSTGKLKEEPLVILYTTKEGSFAVGPSKTWVSSVSVADVPPLYPFVIPGVWNAWELDLVHVPQKPSLVLIYPLSEPISCVTYSIDSIGLFFKEPKFK